MGNIKRIKNNKKVMICIDDETLDRLDRLLMQHPLMENRSHLIRYAARMALEELEKDIVNKEVLNANIGSA